MDSLASIVASNLHQNEIPKLLILKVTLLLIVLRKKKLKQCLALSGHKGVCANDMSRWDMDLNGA